MKKLNLVLILALIPILYAKAQSREPATNTMPQHILFQLAEEEYVDDIPFNTNLIASETMLCNLTGMEEAMVNDIPFNTEAVYLQCCLKKCTMKWRNEANVDDIPFNTCYLACCHEAVRKILPACNAMFHVARICMKSQKEVYQGLLSLTLYFLENASELMVDQDETIIAKSSGPNPEFDGPHALQRIENQGYGKSIFNPDFNTREFIEDLIARIKTMESNSSELLQ